MPELIWNNYFQLHFGLKYTQIRSLVSKAADLLERGNREYCVVCLFGTRYNKMRDVQTFPFFMSLLLLHCYFWSAYFHCQCSRFVCSFKDILTCILGIKHILGTLFKSRQLQK